MTAIHSGAHRIEVKPKMLTLRTHTEMTTWKQKLTARAAQTGQTKNVELVLKLMKEIPDLAELITPSGDFNMSTVARLSENFKDMTKEEAIEAAKSDIQRRILAIAADSPDVARTLFFPDVKINYDAESIGLCIECIRATFDVNGVAPEHVQLLMSDATSDFWQDVEWEGVVAYAEKFCELFK